MCVQFRIDWDVQRKLLRPVMHTYGFIHMRTLDSGTALLKMEAVRDTWRCVQLVAKPILELDSGSRVTYIMKAIRCWTGDQEHTKIGGHAPQGSPKERKRCESEWSPVPGLTVVASLLLSSPILFGSCQHLAGTSWCHAAFTANLCSVGITLQDFLLLNQALLLVRDLALTRMGFVNARIQLLFETTSSPPVLLIWVLMRQSLKKKKKKLLPKDWTHFNRQRGLLDLVEEYGLVWRRNSVCYCAWDNCFAELCGKFLTFRENHSRQWNSNKGCFVIWDLR